MTPTDTPSLAEIIGAKDAKASWGRRLAFKLLNISKTFIELN